MPTYAVDYTGSAPANRIIETKQLSAANFRNYWVVIPDYAPFYRQGLVVKNASTNDVLVENVHYYLTHEFREASLSIGKPIFGSISFIRSAISFDIAIEYQTLGGNWVVNINDIGSILANMIANPRITRWTQVQGYPATFPPINHDVSADPDLTGMTEVVSVLNGIIVALGQRNQQAPIQQPSIVAASIPETLAGILTNKATTPAGVKAVADDTKSTLRTDIAESDIKMTAMIEASTAEIVGDTFFVNDAYKVSLADVGGFPGCKIKNGVSFIGGKKVVKEIDSEFTLGVTYPVEIVNNVTVAPDGSIANVTQSDVKSYPVTNYLTYGDMPELAGWTTVGSCNIAYKTGYNSKNQLTGMTITSTDNSGLYRYLYSDSFIIGEMLNFSFTYDAPKNMTIVIWCGGRINSYDIPKGKQRITTFISVGPVPILSFYFYNEDASASRKITLSEMQITKHFTTITSTFPDQLNNAAYVKTNLTVASDSSLVGSFSNTRFYDKIVETTANGLHELSRQFTVTKNRSYNFTVSVKAEERSNIQLFASGSGVTSGAELNAYCDITTASIVSNNFPMGTSAHFYVVANPYAPGLVTIYVQIFAIANGLATFGIRTGLTNGVISYAGTAGSGLSIAQFSISCNGIDVNSPAYLSEFVANTPRLNSAVTNIINLKVKNYAAYNVRNILNASLMTAMDDYNTKNYYTQKGFRNLDNGYKTYMFELKPMGCSKVRLILTNINTSNVVVGSLSVDFDLLNITNLAVVKNGLPAVNCTPTITSLSNGWVRIAISADNMGINSVVRTELYMLDDNYISNFIAPPNYSLYLGGSGAEDGSAFTTYSDSNAIDIVPMLEYIDTYSLPRTKYIANNMFLVDNDYIDNAGCVHYVNNIATCIDTPVPKVLDKRNVLYTNDALIKGITKTYNVANSGDYIEPNTKTICTNGSAYYLKPLALSNEGDSYIFVKENGLANSPTIYSSANGDQMVFFNYGTNATVTESSIIYNTQGLLEITVINGKFHVFF